MNEAWPLANELTDERRPLMRVRVEPVPNPRSDTDEAPTGVSLDKAPEVAVVKVPVPPPVMVRSCINSPIRWAPDSRMSSRLICTAWVPPLRSSPLMWVPVTSTSSRLSSATSEGACARSASAPAQARLSGW